MVRAPKILLAAVLLASPVGCKQLVIGAKDSGTGSTGTTGQAGQPGTGGAGTGTAGGANGAAAGGTAANAPGTNASGAVVAAGPAQFTVNIPNNNILDDGLLYSMIDAFN